MMISLRNLSFAYAEKAIFKRLNAGFTGGEAGQPLAILGPSGSGKTTLLKLLGGLLKPQEGEIIFHGETAEEAVNVREDKITLSGQPKSAFMFQEPRLLPWLTVLENVSLPLEKEMGREEAQKRARRFLSLVSLEDKTGTYPKELSGGEAQRVSMARAFAWPAPMLLMDEPFQSLDLPLRMNLMDLTLSLLEKEKHFLVAVTHDPREAVYLGGRIIILGRAGEGIVFDRNVDLNTNERVYGSVAGAELEREMILALSSS